ncbi:MFS transporter [Gordonibacter sp.]|uniref:MFS transporter n=1 Tax=Gordonibacter sp. TaxID=1968902 RepID=UPI002FCC438E
MAEEKKGMHRAWLVFIGVCMMMAGGMGLVLNVMGNYFAPMAMAFGLVTPEGKPDVTQVTLLMTVYSYVMLVWLPFAGRLFSKVDARILFGAGGALVAVGVALLGVWTEVWQIYISGAMFGLAGPMIFLVGPSVLINNWFAPRQAGKFLGIASAFTGVGTFVWSPLFAGLIKSNGYQTAFFVEAAVAAVLILIPALFLFRTRPEDVGLKPFGIEKEQAVDGEAPRKSGVSGKFALGTVAFYCIFVAACLISLGGGYKSLMPTAVQSVGGPDLAMLGASMISAAAVGNILGKIVLGSLADKIGIRNSMAAFAVVNMIGFGIMVAMLGTNEVAMLAAGFCIGTGDAMMSVGLPLLTRSCYGDRDYAKIYSYLNMGIAVLGGLGATFVAFVASMTGGFQAAYGCGIAFEAVIIVAVVIAAVTAKKFRDKWTAEGEPDQSRA